LYRYQIISGEEMTSAIISNMRPKVKPIPIRWMILTRILTRDGRELKRIRIHTMSMIPMPIAAFFISCALGARDSTSVTVR
jgi:polyribonucleotide nucleotidyltransferase